MSALWNNLFSPLYPTFNSEATETIIVRKITKMEMNESLQPDKSSDDLSNRMLLKINYDEFITIWIYPSFISLYYSWNQIWELVFQYLLIKRV